MSRLTKNFSYGSTKWCSSGGYGDRSSRLRIVASASLKSSGGFGLGAADTSNWNSYMWSRGAQRGSLGRLIFGHITCNVNLRTGAKKEFESGTSRAGSQRIWD